MDDDEGGIGREATWIDLAAGTVLALALAALLLLVLN